MVNIKFVKKLKKIKKGRIDYYGDPYVFQFEIIWDKKKEDIGLIEKEFKLNVRNQFKDYFGGEKGFVK